VTSGGDFPVPGPGNFKLRFRTYPGLSYESLRQSIQQFLIPRPGWRLHRVGCRRAVFRAARRVGLGGRVATVSSAAAGFALDPGAGSPPLIMG